MRRVSELVHGRDAVEFKAAIEKDACVAGECRRIARHGYHVSDLARCELLGLSLRALPRWIEYDAIDLPQLLRHQRTAK